MKLPSIPNVYLGDFVRGYFDGDGCVYFKKHFVKVRRKCRWVFSTRFTSGSKSFLQSLKGCLSLIVEGGAIHAKSNKRGFELVFSHKDSVALYELMYHNNCHNLYLKRKYKLFSKAVRTLYGDKLRV